MGTYEADERTGGIEPYCAPEDEHATGKDTTIRETVPHKLKLRGVVPACATSQVALRYS